MALKPILDADGRPIGFADDDVYEPMWKPWKGGEYDDSDGKFVNCQSHVIQLSDGRIGRAWGPRWQLVTNYRHATPDDKSLGYL